MSDRIFRAIGLMSGTSGDGIDVSFIETDGHRYVKQIAGATYPVYDAAFRKKLQEKCFGHKEGANNPEIAEIERELTIRHASCVERFLKERGIETGSVDLIGFHGQTIYHNPPPDGQETVQIGDGALLARLTGISVVNDFRTADVQVGGQGAPLLPLYHYALAFSLPKRIVIVNIGGISNATWIGTEDQDVLAFDMGPGNALIDDWMYRHTGERCDKNGDAAARGHADMGRVEALLQHPFFLRQPPKSLDRDIFQNFMPSENCSVEDGAATLTKMTIQSIVQGLAWIPQKPEKIYVTGGGRHNATMMKMLQDSSGILVEKVENLGWNGDGLEAEGFAYLAVRSRLGLPLSLPTTTGVPQPTTGGKHHAA